MRNSDEGSFERLRQLSALLAKDYAKGFLTLLVIYKDISASEAAARLNLHIKTAQDFLQGLSDAAVVTKHEAMEAKRPYFRYALRQRRLIAAFDLDELYDPESQAAARDWTIRERKNSGALFKEGRGGRISSVHVFEGRGRSREERRYSLTERQGRFLFHLPFPTEEPRRVREIMDKAGLGDEDFPEIMDIVGILLTRGVIERVADQL
ncbi:MAG: hypothetical protein JXE07_03375 [Candidatus Aminicenantes bacterium]|nr:hypothetical protein [Candidatus Aminicenantes bacterium]